MSQVRNGQTAEVSDALKTVLDGFINQNRDILYGISNIRGDKDGLQRIYMDPDEKDRIARNVGILDRLNDLTGPLANKARQRQCSKQPIKFSRKHSPANPASHWWVNSTRAKAPCPISRWAPPLANESHGNPFATGSGHLGSPSAHKVDMQGNHDPIDLEKVDEVEFDGTRYIHITMQAETLQLCDLIHMPGISDPDMPKDLWEYSSARRITVSGAPMPRKPDGREKLQFAKCCRPEPKATICC